MNGTVVDSLVDFLDSAEASIVSARSSRAAQHYECVVFPEALPDWIVQQPLDTSGLESSEDSGTSALSSADSTVRTLIGFESMAEDWDGAGAEKPRSASIKAARRFVRALAPESRVPLATLHADGNVILFVRDSDGYAEIEFFESGRIGYFLSRGDRKWSGEGVQVDFSKLPAGFQQFGFYAP